MNIESQMLRNKIIENIDILMQNYSVKKDKVKLEISNSNSDIENIFLKSQATYLDGKYTTETIYKPKLTPDGKITINKILS